MLAEEMIIEKGTKHLCSLCFNNCSFIINAKYL